MPYNEFRALNPKILNLLLEDYKRKKEEENRVMDIQAWQVGLYVREAIASALGGKKHSYPKTPYSMCEETHELSGEEKFKLWVMEYNKKFEG